MYALITEALLISVILRENIYNKLNLISCLNKNFILPGSKN